MKYIFISHKFKVMSRCMPSICLNSICCPFCSPGGKTFFSREDGNESARVVSLRRIHQTKWPAWLRAQHQIQDFSR